MSKGPISKAFLSLGFRSGKHSKTRGQFKGIINGRQATVFLRPVFKHSHFSGSNADEYLGHNIEIYLDMKVNTRLVIGPPIALSDAVDNVLKSEAHEIENNSYKGLSIKTIDRDWAYELTSNREFQEIINTLFSGKDYTCKALRLDPGVVFLFVMSSRNLISNEMVRPWFAALEKIAHIAEKQAPPTITAEPSALEVDARTDRKNVKLIAVAIVIVFFAVILGIVGLVLLLVL